MTIFNTSTRHADGNPAAYLDIDYNITTAIDANNFDSNYVTHSFYPTGDGDYIEYTVEHPQPAGDELWIHFNFKYGSTNGDDDGYLLYVYDANDNPVLWIDTSNSNLIAYVYGEATSSGQDWNAMKGSTWRTIDIRLTVDGLITKAQLFVNNVLQTGLETVNVVPTVGKPVKTVFNMTDMSGSSEGYISEIIIADEETRGMRLAEFSLTTAGTYSQFDSGDLTTSFDNDDTTYTSSNTALQKTSGTIGAYSGSTTNYEIREVIVKSRGWKTPNSSINDFRHFVRIGGTDYENATLHTIDGDKKQSYNSGYTVNPATAVAWTFSDLVGLEAGLKTE
jgi:hypothetical protein